MIDFADPIWATVEGGYRTKYNPTSALRKIENSTSPTQLDEGYKELWEELHHQGDVGTASYLALPQLVRIAKQKNLFDWNILGLCAVIEQQRVLGNNPPLLKEYVAYYNAGLKELKNYVLSNIDRELDDTTYRIALSALVTAKGNVKLGKAIMELDEDVLDEFLEQF